LSSPSPEQIKLATTLTDIADSTTKPNPLNEESQSLASTAQPLALNGESQNPDDRQGTSITPQSEDIFDGSLGTKPNPLNEESQSLDPAAQPLALHGESEKPEVSLSKFGETQLDATPTASPAQQDTRDLETQKLLSPSPEQIKLASTLTDIAAATPKPNTPNEESQNLVSTAQPLAYNGESQRNSDIENPSLSKSGEALLGEALLEVTSTASPAAQQDASVLETQKLSSPSPEQIKLATTLTDIADSTTKPNPLNEESQSLASTAQPLALNGESQNPDDRQGTSITPQSEDIFDGSLGTKPNPLNEESQSLVSTAHPLALNGETLSTQSEYIFDNSARIEEHIVSLDPHRIRGMSTYELVTKAREKTLLLGDEDCAVGHFDALFKRNGKPLGLSFKLSDRKSRRGNVAELHQALKQSGASLAAPGHDEKLTFGKFEGTTMKTVADMHQKYCVWVLQQERDSRDVSIDVLRFVLYLRTHRSDIEDREEKWLKESQTLLVVDVIAGGCVDKYNRAQASEGNWDRVVVPGMQITSVNGISQDPVEMGTALCNSQISTVRFLHLLSVSEDQTSERMSDRIAENMQLLLQERASKLISMELVDATRTPDDWEAMTTKLAKSLVIEVQQGERQLSSALIQQKAYNAASLPSGVPSPPPTSNAKSPRAPLLPPGFPPALPPMPGVPMNFRSPCLGDLSDSDESV